MSSGQPGRWVFKGSLTSYVSVSSTPELLPHDLSSVAQSLLKSGSTFEAVNRVAAQRRSSVNTPSISDQGMGDLQHRPSATGRAELARFF